MDPRPPTPPGPAPPGPDPQPPTPTPDPGPLPPEPSDYAAISLVFGSLLAGLAASSRSRDPIPRADLVPLSAATFSLSRLIVHDKVESWLREPFVIEDGDEKRPKGRRMR